MALENPVAGQSREQKSPEHSVVEVVDVLVDQDVQDYWNILNDGFRDLNEASLINQDMTFEEFEHDAKNPNVLKFKTTVDGEPVALLHAHKGLDDISWVNTAPLAEYAARTTDQDLARIYYVGTLVVKPDRRGLKAFLDLMRYVADYFETDNMETDNNTLVFFDHSKENEALPKLIQRSFRKDTDTGERIFDIHELGTHSWYLGSLEANESLSLSDADIEVSNVLDDPELVDRLYRSYLAEFAEAGFGEPFDGKQDFVDKLKDPRILKVIKKGAEPRLVLVHRELPDYYSRSYLDVHGQSEKLFYFEDVIGPVDDLQEQMVATAVKTLNHTEEELYGSVEVIFDSADDGKKKLFQTNPYFRVTHLQTGEQQYYWCTRGKNT